MKKLLSLVLALSLVLGSFGMAYAAPLTDGIEDKDVVSAVERLSAFGIVNGMEDGKYHPEQDVTREQFAKLVVEALGLGNAAAAAQGPTKFSDVEADRWSAGYINVAVGQGVIKGMSETTFAPAEKVSYAQAVTMLVRALGYKDEFLPGAWPGNYVAKAAELDITDKVTFSPTGFANRGSVAILVDNTLDAKVIKQKTYGDSSEWTDIGTQTLLAEKLNFAKYEEVSIEAVPKVDEDLKANEITFDGDLDGDYETVEGLDTTNLLGLDAEVYLNSKDEVVYVDVTTPEKDIVTGYITEVDGDTVTVQFADADDEDYDVNSPVVYEDNSTTGAALEAGQYGRFILDDQGEIKFADVYNFTTNGLIVKEINKDKEYFKGLLATQDAKKVEFNTEDGYKIFLNGSLVTIDEVKVDDTIYTAEVNEFDGDTYTYVFVVRNAIEGALEKAKNDEFTVGGETYDTAANFTYTLDNNDNIKNDYDAEKVEDVMKETAKVYLDIKGEARHLVANVEETSNTLYGIVDKADFTISGDDAVRLYTKDDSNVSYKFEEADDATVAELNDVVSYELNKDGEIADGEYTQIVDGDDLTTALDSDEETIVEFDDDKDFILYDTNKKAYITDSTVIMSYYDGTDVDPAVVKWEDIKGQDAAGVRMVVVMDEDGINAEFVLFTDNYELESDGYSAFVTGDKYYDGDWKIDVELFDGSSKTYVLEDKDMDIEEGNFIVFTANEANEMNDTVVKAVYDNHAETSISFGDYEVVAGTVVKFANNIVKVGTESFKLTNETAVYVLTLDDAEYDEAEKGDFSDIDEDAVVRLIINDGDVEMVIVVE